MKSSNFAFWTVAVVCWVFLVSDSIAQAEEVIPAPGGFLQVQTSDSWNGGQPSQFDLPQPNTNTITRLCNIDGSATVTHLKAEFVGNINKPGGAYTKYLWTISGTPADTEINMKRWGCGPQGNCGPLATNLTLPIKVDVTTDGSSIVIKNRPNKKPAAWESKIANPTYFANVLIHPFLAVGFTISGAGCPPTPADTPTPTPSPTPGILEVK